MSFDMSSFPPLPSLTRKGKMSRETMDCSSDESVALINRVKKRKGKRSEEDCSDIDTKGKQRKKIPVPATSDEDDTDEEQHKKAQIETPKSTSYDIASIKHFVYQCRKMKCADIDEENLAAIRDSVINMYEIILEQREENESLRRDKTKTSDIEEKIKKLDSVVQDATKAIRLLEAESQRINSYADKVRAPPVINNTSISASATRHVVAIYPSAGSKIKTSDATKETLMSNIAPAKEKIKVRAVKKISNNGVLVETSTKEEMERVLKSEKLAAAGLVTGLPAKKRPLLIVYDVPSSVSEKEFLSSLRQQNLKNVAKDKLNEEVRITHRTGNSHTDASNIVLEVTAKTRETLLRQGRLFIGWQALRIRDYLAVTRCFRCQSYGHVSKYCKASSESCGHCGRAGHAYKNCTKTKDDPECINCKRAAKPCDHSSRSTECPAYRSALSNLISKIDYGE